MKKLITVHLVAALQSKTGVSYVVCNIPIGNKQKVLDIYSDSEKWYIEYHLTPYNNQVCFR